MPLPARPTSASQLAHLSRRHGVRVVPTTPCSVTDVCNAVAVHIGGSEHIVAASRMYGAIVLFLDSLDKAADAVVNGAVIGGSLTPVEPLDAPARRVILSNTPPFISDEAVSAELSRFGKLVSPVKLAYLEDAHIVVFRRQVMMVFSEGRTELDAALKIPFQGHVYTVFANSGRMKCFGCGAEGHLRRACPARLDPSAPCRDARTPARAGPSGPWGGAPAAPQGARAGLPGARSSPGRGGVEVTPVDARRGPVGPGGGAAEPGLTDAGPGLPGPVDGAAEPGPPGSVAGPDGPGLPAPVDGAAVPGPPESLAGPVGPGLPVSVYGAAAPGPPESLAGPVGPGLPEPVDGAAAPGPPATVAGPAGPGLPESVDGAAGPGPPESVAGPDGPGLPGPVDGAAVPGPPVSVDGAAVPGPPGLPGPVADPRGPGPAVPGPSRPFGEAPVEVGLDDVGLGFDDVIADMDFTTVSPRRGSKRDKRKSDGGSPRTDEPCKVPRSSDARPYTAAAVITFLEETKGAKEVAVEDYFPDLWRFKSVAGPLARDAAVREGTVSKQEQFRIKKFLTRVSKVLASEGSDMGAGQAS